MTGFELRTSGVGNDRYINWATTSVTRWLNYFTTTKTCSIASQFCQSKIKSTKLTLKILPTAFKILPQRRHFVKSGHTGPTTLPKLQTTFVNISHLSETCFRFFNFPARKKPTVTSSTGQGGQGGPGAIVNTSKRDCTRFYDEHFSRNLCLPVWSIPIGRQKMKIQSDGLKQVSIK